MTISSQTQPRVVGELTFSAAVGTAIAVSTSRLVPGLESGDSTTNLNNPALPSQFLTLFANHSLSAGTATIVLYYADADIPGGSGKLGVIDTLTIAASATLRQSYDNASGNYVATVVAAVLNRNVVDIHPGVGRNTGVPNIYAACTVLSGGTVTLQFAPGRAI